MLSKTTISALRALVYLARQEEGTCLSPRRIAELLDESPTYLAKSLRYLVKANVLRAEMGVRGGVRLAQRPEEITLLAVVEACQGAIVGDYCESSRPQGSWCAFHQAALELHNAIKGVLSGWTLAQLLLLPHAEASGDGVRDCVMGGIPSARGQALTRIGT
ncbi:MAG: Rrf2 family transcriptional regulator [Acidobacteria bacterium]|nr:Rrf2 family transcriptional regulator [Acidobacteriota bacterium]